MQPISLLFISHKKYRLFAVRLYLTLMLVSISAMPVSALAHSCPLEMHKIDQALATKSNRDAATLKKVRELRAEGEKLHRQDKHGEAMLTLGSAKKLLGIE